MRNMLSIAQNTRRIINERGLKYSAVARKAGYDARKFSAMLCGRKIITAEDIMPIANALNVTPNDLFEIH